MPVKKERKKFLSVRFDLDNSDHLKAWNYLMDSKGNTFRSYNEAALSAIIESVERKLMLEKDSFFETRQKEDDFVNKIVSTVGARLEKELPNFILSCLANFAIANHMPPKDEPLKYSANIPDNAEIDWDFLGDD